MTQNNNTHCCVYTTPCNIQILNSYQNVHKQTYHQHKINRLQLFTSINKKPSCRKDSRPYTASQQMFIKLAIVAKTASPAVFAILGPKHIGGPDHDLSVSRDVIGYVTIRFRIGHFLFASSDSFSSKTHHLIYVTNRLQTDAKHCSSTVG